MTPDPFESAPFESANGHGILQYGRLPRRRIRMWAIGMIATSAVVIVAVAYWRTDLRAAFQYWQYWRDLRNGCRASAAVVWEEDPDRAADLLASDGAYRKRAFYEGVYWRHPNADKLRSLGIHDVAPCFAMRIGHLPDGEQCLVGLGIPEGDGDFGPSAVSSRNLVIYLLRRRGLRELPVGVQFHEQLRIYVPHGTPLRLYAPEPDPADRTRLTLRYQVPSGAGTIDVALERSSVRCSIRDGPLRKVREDWLKMHPETPPIRPDDLGLPPSKPPSLSKEALPR